MNVIMIEESAFYELIDKVLEHVRDKHNEAENRWIDGSEVMSILGIRTTTLQKLRDEGKIEFSKMGRNILYNRDSVEEYIRKNKRATF